MSCADSDTAKACGTVGSGLHQAEEHNNDDLKPHGRQRYIYGQEAESKRFEQLERSKPPAYSTVQGYLCDKNGFPGVLMSPARMVQRMSNEACSCVVL